MTEAEWLNASKCDLMVDLLEDNGKLSERKTRLFAVACGRRAWPFMVDERSRRAVEISEQYADGLVGNKSLRAMRHQAFLATTSPTYTSNGLDPRLIETAAIVALNTCMNAKKEGNKSIALSTAGCENALVFRAFGDAAGWAALSDQCILIRCIFGSPFHPVTLNPSWLTSTVLALATGIYSEKAFDRMPILADALQDAGCDNDEILQHCRGPGPHVRGCFLIDLLLGKK